MMRDTFAVVRRPVNARKTAMNYDEKSAILLLLLFAALAAGAQPFYRKPVAPVRNVIVMIPDGTSTSVLAAARWYKFYNDPSQRTLNLDSCLCGLVGSFSSDSPIPCSAPAMSAYMTGMPQQAGNVSVYPAANPAQDIVEVESGRPVSRWRRCSKRPSTTGERLRDSS